MGRSGATASKIRAIYNKRAIIACDGASYRPSVVKDIDVVQNFKNNLDQYVCDVGCGLGWHLEEFHRRGYKRLYGIDLSEQMLERFSERSHAVKRGQIKLVNGDVRKWQVRGFFDITTAFLNCIGGFSAEGSILFLRSLSRITSSDGVVIFSCFTDDHPESISGNSKARYSATSCITVESRVSLDKSKKWLTIAQQIGPQVKVPNERIYLYSISEIEALAGMAGLDVKSIMRPTIKCQTHPSTTVITAVPRRAS
jgi:SAM-dependent methyltransferase